MKEGRRVVVTPAHVNCMVTLGAHDIILATQHFFTCTHRQFWANNSEKGPAPLHLHRCRDGRQVAAGGTAALWQNRERGMHVRLKFLNHVSPSRANHTAGRPAAS